jgi:ABC-type transport system involved in multi-copper enzyme maturation permease subunit
MSAPAAHARWFVRDTALVARFELAEALRSKLLIVMLLLFVGTGAMSAWGYTEFIGQIEQRAASALDAPTTRRPGGMMRRLRNTTSYRDMVRLFIRDEKKADYFAALPPIVVFFGWASFLFTPGLVVFTSAETIASEVAARSIRYSLLRTRRLPYALGKMAGQAAILVGVTGLSALVFFLVAWAQLDGFEPGATAAGMLSYWPRIVLYNLPFLAWAMFASMATASAMLARILSLGGAVGLWLLSVLPNLPFIRGRAGAEAVTASLGVLTPFGHNEGLAYPPGGALPGDVAVCVTLTVLYFAAGFAILRRRDV